MGFQVIKITLERTLHRRRCSVEMVFLSASQRSLLYNIRSHRIDRVTFDRN
jgi:hypothetical protein